MHLLEPRARPSKIMRWTAPLIAIVATLAAGSLLFWSLGKPVLESFEVFFIEPMTSSYGWSELLIKACPLILIAQGLAIGFKARIYNIGAEGQLIVGALAGGWVAIVTDGSDSAWILPAMVLAGAIGGALWGAIPALLRTRFNASETLTTLMLTYVASLLLAWLMNGPWRDPDGMNFPQSIMFSDRALFSILLEGSRVNTSMFITGFAVLAFWLFNARSFMHFQIEVGGLAPAASHYAGFSSRQTIWLCLVISGMTAGIAGVGEIAGPVGQLNLNISPGYGFAAIIVAHLGRLHAIGIVLAAFIMALIYLGGEAAQVALQMPSAITGVFQGMLLFFLLGSDVFIDNRLRKL